jgi:hypothetical protein
LLPLSLFASMQVSVAYVNTLRTGDANLRLLRYDCE